MPDRDSDAFSLQDPLNSLGQDLAAPTTRQVLLRADALTEDGKGGNEMTIKPCPTVAPLLSSFKTR
jgi:hypothetical protein